MKIITPSGLSLSEAMRNAAYIHHQDSASAVWTANHPLNRRPNYIIELSGGRITNAKVEFPSDSQIVVTHGALESGKIYLS